MIPPVNPTILSSNPKFGALYIDLCNNKLNADGTSKLDAKAQRDRDGLDEELRKCRIQGAKRDLTRNGLSEISYREEELPEDLRQLVAIVVALLEGQVAEEDRYLLQDDLMKFKSNIDKINAAMSKKFQQGVNSLSSMLAFSNSSPTTALPAALTDLKFSISKSTTELETHRLTLADEVIQLHSLYRQILNRSIHLLEQVIHGSVSRSAKARADYLALVAEGMEKKLRLQHAQVNSQMFSSEVLSALEARASSLRTESGSVRKKVREAEAELEAYESGGAGMQGLVREYAEVLAEVERVRADIERLEEVE